MRPEEQGVAVAAGWLRRLDARAKLFFAMAFVLIVVAIPIGSWRALGGAGLLLALVVGMSGASVSTLLLRWVGFAALVGFLAVVVAASHPARPTYGAAPIAFTILAKNSLAFVMMLALAEVTSWAALLRALTRMRVPGVLVNTLLFMERFFHVLGDELARMVQARRARTFHGGRLTEWRQGTGIIGTLLVRSLERSERVQSALVARGWDGTFRRLDLEVARRMMSEPVGPTEAPSAPGVRITQPR